LAVAFFTDEEGSRFAPDMLGSLVFVGGMALETALDVQGIDGSRLGDELERIGYAGPVPCPSLTPHAFVELHIEQGPLLEQRGLDIGVVTAIAAPASLRLRVEGEGGHAGAVLMPDRRDAFLAGAEIALAVEAAARATGAIDTVATVGVCEVFPGAINSVPSRTMLTVDVRDIDGVRRDGVLAAIERACDDVAARRRVSVAVEIINADPPCRCAPEIVEAIEAAARGRGFSAIPLISRAYHDALFMSRVAPTGMIFIPCRGGVSHRPDEYASPEAIARGVAVLADTLARLAA
jgi:N-carbamoyl-L-amino-acid hydrolase